MSDACIEIHSETARVRAALVNSGRLTFAEADTKLAASRLLIILGEDAANTSAGQAAFLTAIVTSTRSFGLVFVQGPVDQLLLLAVPAAARTLRDAIALFRCKNCHGPFWVPADRHWNLSHQNRGMVCAGILGRLDGGDHTVC